MQSHTQWLHGCEILRLNFQDECLHPRTKFSEEKWKRNSSITCVSSENQTELFHSVL